jgi:hypothetical protein
MPHAWSRRGSPPRFVALKRSSAHGTVAVEQPRWCGARGYPSAGAPCGPPSAAARAPRCARRAPPDAVGSRPPSAGSLAVERGQRIEEAARLRLHLERGREVRRQAIALWALDREHDGHRVPDLQPSIAPVRRAERQDMPPPGLRQCPAHRGCRHAPRLANPCMNANPFAMVFIHFPQRPDTLTGGVCR